VTFAEVKSIISSMEKMVDENVRDYLSTWSTAFIKSLEVAVQKEPIVTAIRESELNKNLLVEIEES
jgi:hypothetical protein